MKQYSPPADLVFVQTRGDLPFHLALTAERRTLCGLRVMIRHLRPKDAEADYSQPVKECCKECREEAA